MNGKNGAVRRMRTRIRLLAQPESMRSIVGATQRERRFCLGPLKLCQYLLTNGVAKTGTETVFGGGRAEGIARD